MERMYSLLVNRSVPEDLSDDYFQNQLPDISELPLKEVSTTPMCSDSIIVENQIHTYECIA